MKLTSLSLFLVSSLWCTATVGQSGPAPTAAPANMQSIQPVSYASVTQLNGMLAQLEASSKNTQADLVKLRIERSQTDGSYKKQSLAQVDSIHPNLPAALPHIPSQSPPPPAALPSTSH